MRPMSSFQLGVDVGGTFTDLVLIDEADNSYHVAKVPSTSPDPSVGVLNGVAQICERAGIDPARVRKVMHGTTVATNAILTSRGARVGLVTTKGYRHVLQIARSFIPGGLGAWVNFNPRRPLAPLALTVEADERTAADGTVIDPLDEGRIRIELQKLGEKKIEALAISLIHAYANGSHEQRIAAIAREELPGVAISMSSEVVPEMQEYERTLTTVANAYVRPAVSLYVENLARELSRSCNGASLNILRSDGGLTSANGAMSDPVKLLMSGPAGGVSGAIWIARQAGHENFLTFDMGGTSTDVCLVRSGEAQTRRETSVGELSVRASSMDTRTVGAGGGSIAYVPELTKALRVGPESAGAVPGPAAYGKGGARPTVTDANIVLGYLPQTSRLGGDMAISREKAAAAIGTIADNLGFTIERAAEGIYNIVNENMIGALRLVSVQQGFDPRDFALVAFGGAGPLHANALGRILNCWPVIIPPGPGVLCAFGDVTTRPRNEASRSHLSRFSQTDTGELVRMLEELAERAACSLDAEGIARADQSIQYQADVRYSGQILHQTIVIDLGRLKAAGLEEIGRDFDRVHERLYTFALEADHEFTNLRAIVQGPATEARATLVAKGDRDPSAAKTGVGEAHFNGEGHVTTIYDRSRLCAGNVIIGPAIVTQIDSTTVILPGFEGRIGPIGVIEIWPTALH